MENKKILLVDMDQVTCNFDKELKRLAPELYLGEGEDYDHRSLILDQVCRDNSGVFLRLEPISGSVEAIKKLSESYEIYFCSTPMSALYESYAHKPEWLNIHFGDWAKKKLILTHRKDLVIGHYLIDDRTRNGAGEFTGEHIHFGTEKFPDWNSVLSYLLK